MRRQAKVWLESARDDLNAGSHALSSWESAFIGGRLMYSSKALHAAMRSDIIR